METEKVTNIGSLVVSASVLSKLIGVTERRIRTLAEEGTLVKVSNGRYKLEESIHSYILNLKVINNAKEQVEYDGKLNLEEERAVHERVKRQIAELKFAVMKGELHKSEDVEDVMSSMLMNFKSRMEGLPSKIVPKLYKHADDKNYILTVLQDAVREALEELSEYNPSDFYGDDYIETETEDE